MNIKAMVKTAVKVLDDKMPVILTGLGVGGLITTAVLSGKAAVKAKNVIDSYDWDRMEPRDKREVIVMDVAPKFIPPVAVGAVSCACIVGAQVKNAGKIAMLATAYTMKDHDLEELREKTKEFLGEKKNNELHSKMAEDRVLEISPEDDRKIFNTGYGDTEFLDLVTGARFTSNIEKIRQVVNDLNMSLNCGEEVSVADLYYDLNIVPGKFEDSIGWDLNQHHKLINVKFDAALRDGNPIITIDYDWDIIDFGIIRCCP